MTATTKKATSLEMVKAAITALKNRKGSSKIAIEKFVRANYQVGENVDRYLKLALKKGVEAGSIVQVKGKGASGSFKLGKVVKPVVKKPKKVVPKKTTLKKAPKPSGAVAKKAAAKKAAKKVTKKAPVKKVPTKKAPAKKAQAKKTAPKPAAKKAKK